MKASAQAPVTELQAMAGGRDPTVCVVGPGARFLSGISYYTYRLVNALAGRHRVSVILMRRLLPARLYPGRTRVGAPLARLQYDASSVLDGVDWYWFPTMFRAVGLLLRERPSVVLFQWWSASVLHSYVALAVVARLLRARVVVEFHEVLDTGEARLPLLRAYVRMIAPLLLRLACGAVVHSDYDRAAVRRQYRTRRPILVVPHGPYDQYRVDTRLHVLSDSVCNVLFFGVIRPFKGLEDLLGAFNAIPEQEIGRYRLTIVGETWEHWTLPAEMIKQSPHRDRITFVNRYVHDDEVGSFFRDADVVVLPYHRSSSSGPLQIAMSCGLPVVVTSVGGLPEAVGGYAGAILVPPKDPVALGKALTIAAGLKGRRFADPHSWETVVDRYDHLFDAISAKRHAAPWVAES